MRDGVTLYSDVYRPVGAGAIPSSSPERPTAPSAFPRPTTRPSTSRSAATCTCFRTYEDATNRTGCWEPFFSNEKDGYDTIEWAAKQPWSDGKVAMQGGSYLGQNQWRAAQAAPPSLVTIFPMVASTSIYHDWMTLNGGWRLSFNFGWGPVRQESRIMQNPGPHTLDGVRAIHYDEVQKHLPLNTMQQLVGRHAKFYDDWLAHPDYDDYWKPLNVEEMFDKIAIPAHTFGGWFDIFSQGTLRGYAGMSQKGATEKARRMSHIVIGPWGHGPTRKFGRLDFGPTANVDALHVQLRWYDYWLKGIDNGFSTEPPVKLFVMGRNEWVSRARVSAGANRLPAVLLHQRRQREHVQRRRPAHLDEARRAGVHARSLPIRSGRSGAVARRQQLLRHADGRGPAGSASRSKVAATSCFTPRTSCRRRSRSPVR